MLQYLTLTRQTAQSSVGYPLMSSPITDREVDYRALGMIASLKLQGVDRYLPTLWLSVRDPHAVTAAVSHSYLEACRLRR